MPIARALVIGLVPMVLVMAIAACGPTAATSGVQGSVRQVQAQATETPTPQSSDAMMWGRVPYCNCLADSATANVAGALARANLTVKLQEQSPRDGWLYFVARFDPHATSWEQVKEAVIAGGAEVLEGPP